jgi:hypothetical protein
MWVLLSRLVLLTYKGMEDVVRSTRSLLKHECQELFIIPTLYILWILSYPPLSDDLTLRDF